MTMYLQRIAARGAGLAPSTLVPPAPSLFAQPFVPMVANAAVNVPESTTPAPADSPRALVSQTNQSASRERVRQPRALSNLNSERTIEPTHARNEPSVERTSQPVTVVPRSAPVSPARDARQSMLSSAASLHAPARASDSAPPKPSGWRETTEPVASPRRVKIEPAPPSAVAAVEPARATIPANTETRPRPEIAHADSAQPPVVQIVPTQGMVEPSNEIKIPKLPALGSPPPTPAPRADDVRVSIGRIDVRVESTSQKMPAAAPRAPVPTPFASMLFARRGLRPIL